MTKLSEAAKTLNEALSVAQPHLEYLDQAEALSAQIEAKHKAATAAMEKAEAAAAAAKERLVGLTAEVEARYAELMKAKAEELAVIRDKLDEKKKQISAIHQALA